MTAIKTFTTLGSMIVFAGFASSASAAVNSENINSSMDFSIASDDNPEDMEYNAEQNSSLCKTANIAEDDTREGYIKQTSGIAIFHNDGSGWQRDSDSIELEGKARSVSAGSSQTFLTTKYVHRKKFTWTVTDTVATNSGTNEDGTCKTDTPGANKYVKQADGTCNAYNQYQKSEYRCQLGQCYYCDMCHAGSYQTCYVAAEDHTKKTEQRKRECWKDSAVEFYEKLAGMIQGLLGSDTDAANFLIATRYIHYDKLGETGKYSENAEKAFLEVLGSTGLMGKADDFYRNLANSTADPDAKYAEALTHAIEHEEMKNAANGKG